MPLYFLHIKYLTAQGEDSLEMAVTALLGGATGGVSLDEEYLTVLRVFVRAVSELSGESATCHGVLALYALTCLTCRDTGSGSKDDLVADEFCLLGVLLQIVAECLTDSLLDGTSHLAVAELRLGLSLELWLSDLDADDCGESSRKSSPAISIFAFSICLEIWGSASAYAFSVRVSAMRNPVRWVPPSMVLILLT